ncbi:MAG: c-type cytochrome [Acidobacteriia bacterium]|nr:c-type cytochrome [Terriglobia bacterium]
MTRILKWALLVVVVLAACGFTAFLYVIPPFFIAAPETFSGPIVAAAPKMDGITDPAERAIAERGRDIALTTGCLGCHGTPGAQGFDLEKYLSGGQLFIESSGRYVSRNLTPDNETGLGRRTDDEVKRVLRSGVLPDGHVAPYTVMPWANFSHWTEEDRHAVVVYLRHLKPARHAIPDAVLKQTPVKDAAIEEAYGGADYGLREK